MDESELESDVGLSNIVTDGSRYTTGACRASRVPIVDSSRGADGCGHRPPSQTLAVSSSDGRRSLLTAVRAAAPITVDGVLDDAVWQTAPAAEAFVQADPREGQPASEATEAYVAFDDEFLYIGARCRDSNPAESS